MSIYSACQWMYGDVDGKLAGKPVDLEYLPTKRSRKWRSANCFVRAYSDDVCLDMARELVNQEGWYGARWVEVVS